MFDVLILLIFSGSEEKRGENKTIAYSKITLIMKLYCSSPALPDENCIVKLLASSYAGRYMTSLEE